MDIDLANLFLPLLLRMLPQTKYLDGHTTVLYKCNNGCMFSSDKTHKILIHTYYGNTVVYNCPYCNSDKLTKIY